MVDNLENGEGIEIWISTGDHRKITNQYLNN